VTCAVHPYFDFDRTKAERCLERLRESEAKTFRASPDLFHMRLERPCKNAASVGKTMVCDPLLPPNSLVALEPEGRIVVAA